MKRTLLYILFCSPLFTYSQTEQAWVFFTQKENINTQLLNPDTFLTPKALLRKQKHSIEIDDRDIPIDNSYINTIKEQDGITYLATSKWFNAVFVEGKKEAIDLLLTIEIVESIFYMNRSLNSSNKTLISSTNTSAKKLKNNNVNTVNIFTYGSTENQTTQLNLDSLHTEGFTGKGVTIAVMDNGFNNVNTITAFDRARDNNLLIEGYDFEAKTADIYAYTGGSHGTNVLSTMLGYIEDNFIGTAIDAHYYLFRTEVDESESPKEEAYWIAAAEKADSLGVDIINSSLGYSTFDDNKYNYATTDMDGKTTFISQGASIASEKGLLVVNSAGNSGDTAWGIITAPADVEKVFSIGAVDLNGDLAYFSSVGPTADGRIKPDVVALGLNTTIITENGTIASSNGTSFSSPIITGAMACLWQSSPDTSAQELIALVKSTSSRALSPGNSLGYGIPNFYDPFLNQDEFLLNEADFSLITNPVFNELTFNFPTNWTSDTYYIYSLLGNQVQSSILEKNAEVAIDNLSAGIYFLKLKNSRNIIKFAKY